MKKVKLLILCLLVFNSLFSQITYKNDDGDKLYTKFDMYSMSYSTDSIKWTTYPFNKIANNAFLYISGYNFVSVPLDMTYIIMSDIYNSYIYFYYADNFKGINNTTTNINSLSNSSSSSSNTTTKVYKVCSQCFGSGTCRICYGLGYTTGYDGTTHFNCSGCNTTGKCCFCNGTGKKY